MIQISHSFFLFLMKFFYQYSVHFLIWFPPWPWRNIWWYINLLHARNLFSPNFLALYKKYTGSFYRLGKVSNVELFSKQLRSSLREGGGEKLLPPMKWRSVHFKNSVQKNMKGTVRKYWAPNQCILCTMARNDSLYKTFFSLCIEA